jgi:hypothetical protein
MATAALHQQAGRALRPRPEDEDRPLLAPCDFLQVTDAHGGFGAAKAASGGTRGLLHSLHGEHAHSAKNLAEHDDSEDRVTTPASSSGGRMADGVVGGVKDNARTFLRARVCSVVWSSPAWKTAKQEPLSCCYCCCGAEEEATHSVALEPRAQASLRAVAGALPARA